MYTKDFLIGAIRASNDLHPQVKTELEEILNRAEPVPVAYTDYGIACGNCQKMLPGGEQNYCPRCGRQVDWT